MLLSLCGGCGKLLPADTVTETVCLEHDGMTEYKSVCLNCYYRIINDESNTLLLEQQ